MNKWIKQEIKILEYYYPKYGNVKELWDLLPKRTPSAIEHIALKLKLRHKHDFSGKNNSMYGRTGELAPGYGRIGDKNPMFGKRGELSPIFGEKNGMYGMTGEKNPHFGKHHTEEVKDKQRKLRTGTHATQETKEKMSRDRSGEKSVWFGKHHTKKTIEKQSLAKLGNKNPMCGKPCPAKAGRGSYGLREDLSNQFFRSTWEANIARFLNFIGTPFTYETTHIKYNGGHRYTIDFDLPNGVHWEIYSFHEKEHLMKINEAKKQGLIVIPIGPKQYKQIEQKYKSQIPFWETKKDNILTNSNRANPMNLLFKYNN